MENKQKDFKISNLEAKFDSKKSFYGKAKVIEREGVIELQSYATIVAKITKEGDNPKVKVFRTYSATTLRHIKEFLRQNGFKAESSKQIMQDYGRKHE